MKKRREGRTTNVDDNTVSLLQLIDIHNTLVTEFLEVEPVGFVEISRDGLRVVVDHDSLLAHVAELASAGNGAPVELDTAADAVDTTAKNHSALVVELDVVGGGIVGGIEVVGMGGVFSGKSVDTLNEGGNAERLPVSTDDEFFAGDEVGDLTVRETLALGTLHEFVVDVLNGTNGLQSAASLNDVIKLVQVPLFGCEDVSLR